ncbi:hypothetical protein OEZ86_005453 [Tetradesmus obliquus]|nr:hypothetical protein OEZ86_005453 [Tetradesmus obliquus]
MLQQHGSPTAWPLWVSIAWVSAVFLWSVILEVYAVKGALHAACHLVWGMWLLVNICYHYYQAVHLAPGYTSDVDLQVLKDAMTFEWRWRGTCNGPKPPMCHHCSMCGRCVLRMDHHCPFTANCVGAANYHHFFLFTLWLTLGCGYTSITSCLWHGKRFTDSSSASLQGHHAILLVCVVTGAVCCGLVVLLAWHCLVAVSGYGTLELMDRWLGPDSNDADAAEAHVHLPHVSCSFWGYLYSRGPRRNWQRALRVSGRWWWLRWWLPAAAVRWDAAATSQRPGAR